MKFVIRTARRGLLRRSQLYFTIVAKNGEVLATSETYSNRGDLDSTIEMIKANAAFARVENRVSGL